jgi:hypothetical protein
MRLSQPVNDDRLPIKLKSAKAVAALLDLVCAVLSFTAAAKGSRSDGAHHRPVPWPVATNAARLVPATAADDFPLR